MAEADPPVPKTDSSRGGDARAPASSTRWPLQRVLRLVVGVVVVAAVVWYLAAQREKLTHLRWVPLSLLPLLVGLRIVGSLTMHRVNLLCVQVFAPGLSFIEYALVAGAAVVADHFVPFGGLSSKALYLHRRHGLAPELLVGAMAYQGALRLVVAGALSAGGVAALTLHGEEIGPLHWLLVAASLGMGVGPLLLLGPLARIGRRFRLLDRFRGGWQALRRAPGLALKVSASATLCSLVIALAAGLLWAAMIPQAVSFLAGATISTMLAVLGVVRFTPGNYGTTEAAVGLLAGSLGIPAAFGALVTIISRVIGLCGFFSMVLGVLILYRLLPSARAIGPIWDLRKRGSGTVAPNDQDV